MDSMNFIDISGWQYGLNLKNLFEVNPLLDGVIVKATGGAGYVQSTCDPWVQEMIRMGKPWGFYHFLDDDSRAAGGKAEAEFFVENCRNYFGIGVPAADYEYPATELGPEYLKEFLDTVYSLTGIKPMVYCSLSVIHEQDLSEIAKAGYPLWLAQYANINGTGIQESPWQSGSVYPFSRYWMHQYSGYGRLNGYSGNLDLDKFYGDIFDWKLLASGEMELPPVDVDDDVNKAVNPEIVAEVLDGKYGIGDERIRKLAQAGYDPKEVQSKINELYAKAPELRKLKAETGPYFDLLIRIATEN